MPPKPRTYDPAKVRAALAAQTEALRGAVQRLCTSPDAERLLARPTRLDGWTVRELVAHLGIVLEGVPEHLHEPVPDGPLLALTDWVAATAPVAPSIGAAAQKYAQDAFGGSPTEVAGEFDLAADALIRVLTGPEAAEPGRRLAIRFGPILLSDYLLTRLVETVVHADDLAVALELPAFPHDRQALAAVTRLLADAFADQVPGGSVELRIPPFAVVQAVPGPKHTRGTPPNVVETDPLTWIRLATGRTDWASAVDEAEVSASGERSDLSGYLPVMG